MPGRLVGCRCGSVARRVQHRRPRRPSAVWFDWARRMLLVACGADSMAQPGRATGLIIPSRSSQTRQKPRSSRQSLRWGSRRSERCAPPLRAVLRIGLISRSSTLGPMLTPPSRELQPVFSIWGDADGLRACDSRAALLQPWSRCWRTKAVWIAPPKRHDSRSIESSNSYLLQLCEVYILLQFPPKCVYSPALTDCMAR